MSEIVKRSRHLGGVYSIAQRNVELPRQEQLHHRELKALSDDLHGDGHALRHKDCYRLERVLSFITNRPHVKCIDTAELAAVAER